VKQALDACTCMEHRGATSADNISGDGAGVMTAIPWELFSGMCDPSKTLNQDGTTACAVGMVFLPR
jgi:glutamate synthase (ferredoxin)